MLSFSLVEYFTLDNFLVLVGKQRREETHFLVENANLTRLFAKMIHSYRRLDSLQSVHELEMAHKSFLANLSGCVNNLQKCRRKSKNSTTATHIRLENLFHSLVTLASRESQGEGRKLSQST